MGTPRKLLLVDAGNTRIKFGILSENQRTGQLPLCTHHAAFRPDVPDFWTGVRGALPGNAGLSQSWISGSNPAQIDRLVAEWPDDWSPPGVLSDRRRLPIEIDVDEPDRVGLDRLLDAVAANILREPGQPAIVIDVGTATTVNAISKSGAFVGGAILAGPELCARSLYEYTAALPYISLEDSSEEPPVIGRNTGAAIQSGLYWGHWQAVSGYCDRMQGPLACPPDPLIVLTGGAAPMYSGRIPPGAKYEPQLTLQGFAVTVFSWLPQENEP